MVKKRVVLLILAILLVVGILFSSCKASLRIIDSSDNGIPVENTIKITVQKHTTMPNLPDTVVVSMLKPPFSYKIITDKETVNALRSAIDSAERVKDVNQEPRGGCCGLSLQFNDKLIGVEKNLLTMDDTYYIVNEDLINTLLEIYNSCDAEEYSKRVN